MRFGIDRREFGEAGWQYVDKPTAAVRKRFFVRADGDPPRYLNGFFNLDCGVGQAVRLTLVRQHGTETSATWPRSISVSLQGQRLDLPYQIASPGLDIRSTTLPAGTFDAVGDTATFGLPDPARNDGSAGGATLNMQGFSTAYAKLRKSCDEPARNFIAGTLPAQPVPYVGQSPAVANSPSPAQTGFSADPRPMPPATKPEYRPPRLARGRVADAVRPRA